MTHRPALKRMRRAISIAMEPLENRCLLSASISLQNLDGLPASNDQLAFNRIQNPNTAINEVTHDTDTLRITNTGDQPLVINSLKLSDTTNWQLVNPPANGVSIPVGGSKDVEVKFIAQHVPPNQPTNETNDTVSTDNLPPSQTGGVWDGTLTIRSNDPSNPTSTVNLAGYWQDESEHEEEPNLQTLVNRLFGYTTVIDSAQQPDYPNNGSTVVPYGQEVLSSYWQAADPSQPVTAVQLFAFHNEQDLDNGQSPAAILSWFAQNSSTDHTIFQHAPNHSQSLLPPLINSTNTTAQGSFSPGNATFGWLVDSESSVDSQNTADITTYARSGHALRFYPLRDTQGNLIANTWLLVMDYQNGSFDNSDYQDNGYIVTNVRPAGQAPAPTNVAATPGSGQVTVSWTGVTDTSLQGYNIYRSNSATGTFTKLNSSPVSGTSFIDSTPLSGTAYYQVSAVDASSESQRVGAIAGTPSGGGTGTGPDLTLGAVVGKFKASAIGNTLSGPSHLTITNSGTAVAKGKVEIDVFLSPSSDSVPSGATPLSRNIRAINLKAGKSITVQLAGFRYPSDLNGQEFIVAQITPLSGITESNTSNNTGSTTASINLAAPFMDLQNLFTGSLPATFASGKRAHLQVPVINNGNVVAHGLATITVTATTSPTVTTLFTRKIPALIPPGKSAKYNLNFLVPTLATGTYFVVTDIELPGDTVSSNNAAASTGTFSVGG